MTQTMLSHGCVVRDYNVSTDISTDHTLYACTCICIYIIHVHNTDHVVSWPGSSRIQCIHGHPRIIHCTCTHMTQTMLFHGRVVREYNVSMDIHGSYIVRVHT